MNDPVEIQYYILGRLSRAATESFEARLTQDPELVRDLEESLRLREGLAHLREHGELGALRRRGSRRLLAAGASIAAMAAVILLYVVSHPFSGPAIAPSVAAYAHHGVAPAPVSSIYTFARTREAASALELPLPRRGILELRALTSAEADRTYWVSLERTDQSSQVSRLVHLKADEDGFVAIYVDASQWAPGTYTLKVGPERIGGSEVQQFEFAFTR